MAPSVDKLNILLAHDSAEMRASVRQILQGFGIEWIIETALQKDAYITFKLNRVDIVIAGARPDNDADLELVAQIRKSEDLKKASVPIILLTGRSVEDWHGPAKQSHVDAVIGIPINPRGLFETIRAILRNFPSEVEAPNYYGPDRRYEENRKTHNRERRIDGMRDPVQKKS